MHALFRRLLVLAFKFNLQSLKTYSKPIANRSMISIFLLVGIRSFQTALAGRIKIMMSEIMLNKHETGMLVLLLRHRASVMSGFHIASRGEQVKMLKKVLIV